MQDTLTRVMGLLVDACVLLGQDDRPIAQAWVRRYKEVVSGLHVPTEVVQCLKTLYEIRSVKRNGKNTHGQPMHVTMVVLKVEDDTERQLGRAVVDWMTPNNF